MVGQDLHSESLRPGFHLDHHPVQGPLTGKGSGLAVTLFHLIDVTMFMAIIPVICQAKLSPYQAEWWSVPLRIRCFSVEPWFSHRGQ